MSRTQSPGNAAAEDVLSNAENEEEELSKDDIYHVLQNERRRSVLRYLEDADGPVRMRDVAEQVAAWENDTTVEQLTSKERQRVYIALYQTHLTKLDEMDIIDYNQSRGIVERKERADRLERYLVDPEEERAADDQSDHGTSTLDPGTAAISTLLVSVVALGASGTTPLTVVLGAIGLLAVGAVAVTQGLSVTSPDE